MNLWDIPNNRWHDQLLGLASNSAKEDLLKKLGFVAQSGGDSFGNISSYFVERYGFNSTCQIIPFTGDNPATILALPLRPLDAIVSLGTSTTFLMSTPEYKPDPSVHFMNHPTTPGLYMFMLCYKNGGLARERLRDTINKDDSHTWDNFNKSMMTTPRLGIRHPVDTMKLGLFFPLPEIVPPLPAGTYRYTYDPKKGDLAKAEGDWWTQYETRAMVEGQMLSLRLRSQNLVRSPEPNPDGIPPQPRRIYLVGGGSQNSAIANVASEVLGGAEGIYRLDVGQNACALGGAYKAVWGCERKDGESFEDLIGKRWREEEFAVKVEEGYQGGYWERYGIALDGFDKMEKQLLEDHRSR
jgi:xylulokinase